MIFKSNKFVLSNETFILLRDFIYDKIGIFFPENKKYLLENKLTSRIEENNLKNFEEYFLFLKYNDHRQSEYPHLFNSVTTGETYFLRNTLQLDVFEKNILPIVLKRIREENRKKIKIWSTACSTGEEPYTLAIILKENRTAMAGIDFEIMGTDINKNVLAAAEKGEYNANSLRNLSKELLQRYFTKPSTHTHLIRPDVKKHITLRNLNLYDKNAMGAMKWFDIIFCRNVMIYFNNEAKIKVIANLHESLYQGGYLFVGHSESLLTIPNSFKLENIKRIPVYKKV